MKSEAELGWYGGGSSCRGADGRPTPLKREADGNRQFYESMSRRADEADVASTVRQSNVRLVGPAQPAAHPYKPNVPLNLALGMFGGLALAIGYVMLQEQTNSALRAPGDAGAYLTLPELGAIPKAEASGGLARWAFWARAMGNHTSNGPRWSSRLRDVSESFRATLASILSASHNGDHPHVMVVTSSRPMEGKTTVVSNLGIALAEIGNKVLLIDGDMRRPQLHKVFDQVNSWGLSDVLREKNAIEELPLEALVKKTAVPRLESAAQRNRHRQHLQPAVLRPNGAAAPAFPAGVRLRAGGRAALSGVCRRQDHGPIRREAAAGGAGGLHRQKDRAGGCATAVSWTEFR